METLPAVVLAVGLSSASCTPRPAGAPPTPSPEPRSGLRLDRSDIERIGATRTTDLLRSLPGVRVVAVTGRAGFAYPHFPELSLAVEIGF